jgi:hypothetical protein
MATATALADGGRQPPSAKELWQSYPLSQPQSDAPSPGPSSGRAAPSRPASARDSRGGGVSWAPLAVLVVVLATGGATFLAVRRRRRADVPADAPPRLDAPTSEVQPMTDRLPVAACPVEPDLPWVAEIVWDQKADAALFRAVARRDGAPDEAIVAQSHPVRWPPAGADAVADMRAAVEELETMLRRAGWKELGRGRTWYAGRFAWQAPARPAPVVAAPSDDEVRWRCEIVRRGALTGPRFVALMSEPGQRRTRRIGSSPTVGWSLPGGAGPRRDERAAVAQLASRLMRAGWEPAVRGEPWYADRFEWRRKAPPPCDLTASNGQRGVPTRPAKAAP